MTGTDVDAAAPTSHAAGRAGWLVLLVFLYFWISLNPFPEISFATAAQAWADKSNLVNQLVVVSMSGLVLLVVLRNEAARLLWQPRLLLLVMFAWLAIVSLSSGDPAAAFRRLVFAALVLMVANAVLVLPRSDRHFARILGIGVLIAIGLSYFGVAFLPRLAIHQATDAVEATLAGDWRGHFGHKNVASAAMVISVFVGLYVASVWSRFVGWTIVVLATIFLFFTGGKTAAVMLPAMLALGWAFENWRWSRWVIAFGGVLTLNVLTVGAAIWAPLRSFVDGLGIDATFTDRASIWQLALSAVSDRPFTGFGFQSFWETATLRSNKSVLATWAVDAANSHNGYVEAVINAGIPGLLIMVLWLVVLPIIDAGKAEANGGDPRLTRLFTRIWLFSIFEGCLESIFFNNTGPLWFSMLVGVFGLRLQASARVIPGPARYAAAVPAHA
jgi:O-antigen ligase